MFDVVPYKAPFIQVLNVNDTHWVTVSNILAQGRHLNDAVYIFDSIRSSKVAATIKAQICSIMRPGVPKLDLLLVDMDRQVNCNDCGLHAVASATELAFGMDPALCKWDHGGMRTHLLTCIEAGAMAQFPVVERRSLRLGRRVRRSSAVLVQCKCRMPSERGRADIQCSMCQKWHHMDCMGLDPNKSYKGVQWFCDTCQICLQ